MYLTLIGFGNCHPCLISYSQAVSFVCIVSKLQASQRSKLIHVLWALIKINLMEHISPVPSHNFLFHYALNNNCSNTADEFLADNSPFSFINSLKDHISLQTIPPSSVCGFFPSCVKELRRHQKIKGKHSR